MSEANKIIRQRPGSSSSQFMTFKSGIFQKKPTYLREQQDSNSVTFPHPTITIHPSNNNDTNSNNSSNVHGQRMKSKNPQSNQLNNRLAFDNKLMAQSSIENYAAHQNNNNLQKNKLQFGSLFNMARQVSEPVDEPESVKKENIQNQTNKFSFLQAPKLNVIKPNKNQNEQKLNHSSMFDSNISLKSPSFLKKSSKSNYDPNEQKQCKDNNTFKKKPQQTDRSINFIPKKFDPISGKSAQSSDEKNIPKKTFEINFSPMKYGNNISPINSVSSHKNKSTNQPQQSPTHNNMLSLPRSNQHTKRKSSLFIPSENDFFTPTQKNSSSGFINSQDSAFQIAESTYKNHTTSNKKSKFLSIAQLKASRTPSESLKQSNEPHSAIPSFIKFKQKRNQLLTSKSSSQLESQLYTKQQFSLNDFQIKERLGKGAFGDVFLARQNQTGFFCVLKKLSKKKIKEQKLQEHIVRQIKIQAALNHKHLTTLYGFFDEQDYIYLVLQYLSDGSLAQKINRKKCAQKEVANYLRQVCEGLKFMHIEDIIHRDIKPQNIFVHENYLKIGDFGCSVCSNTKRNTVVGCLAYISPQQLNNQSYDDKIDVWSVGVLAYELLTGRPPFQQDIIKIARHQKEAKLSQLQFPTTLELSQDAKDFIKQLLQQNPDNRMTIIQALKHPFITKNIATVDASISNLSI